jgi:peptidoglycan hydrolase-like protein with peptidoglycan-binding domain
MAGLATTAATEEPATITAVDMVIRPMVIISTCRMTTMDTTRIRNMRVILTLTRTTVSQVTDTTRHWLRRCKSAWPTLATTTGVIDGIMGPQTSAAIGAYETTHNMVADGTISSRLRARLGLS